MRNLLALLALVALTLAGVGWYLGWFAVHTTPAADGHRHVDIDIDGKKISDDLRKGGKEVIDTAEQKFEQTPSTGKQTSPATNPALGKSAPATRRG